MTATIEVLRRVWDDEEGVCFEIRPDQDGIGYIELHTPDEKSKEYYGNIRFSLNKEIARKVGSALIQAAEELD